MTCARTRKYLFISTVLDAVRKCKSDDEAVYEWENRNVLRHCLKIASDGAELVTWDGSPLCVGAGNWESSPTNSRQTTWQYYQTMGGRGPQPLP